jgi:CBS domain-containing protein
VPGDRSASRIAAATHDAEGRTASSVRVGCPFLGSSYSPRLQDRDLSALLILNGYRLVGIITERDIVRAVADRRALADFSAGVLEVESATTG